MHKILNLSTSKNSACLGLEPRSGNDVGLEFLWDNTMTNIETKGRGGGGLCLFVPSGSGRRYLACGGSRIAFAVVEALGRRSLTAVPLLLAALLPEMSSAFGRLAFGLFGADNLRPNSTR